jgi:hypothetical protein
MKSQTKKYCVRNFGNDREYDDIDQLLDGLHNEYAGKSIAVHIRTKTGMLHAMFVDVDDNGTLFESYPRGGPTRVTRDTIISVCA